MWECRTASEHTIVTGNMPLLRLLWNPCYEVDRRREAVSRFRAVPCRAFFFKINRYSRGLEGWSLKRSFDWNTSWTTSQIKWDLCVLKNPKPNLIWKDRRREAVSRFRAVPCRAVPFLQD